jgi:ankyrin repeat protein
MANLDSKIAENLQVRNNIEIYPMNNDHDHSDTHPNILVLPTRHEISQTQQLEQQMENLAYSQRRLASGILRSESCNDDTHQSDLNTYLSLSPNVIHDGESYRKEDDNYDFANFHDPYSLHGDYPTSMDSLYPTFLSSNDMHSMSSSVYSRNHDVDLSLEKDLIHYSDHVHGSARETYDVMTQLTQDMNNLSSQNFESSNVMSDDLTAFHAYNSAAYPDINMNYSIPSQNECLNQYSGDRSFEISSAFQGIPIEKSINYSTRLVTGCDAHGSIFHSPSFDVDMVHELYRLILQTREDSNLFQDNDKRHTSGSWDLVRHYLLTADFDLVNTAARITSPAGLTPLHQACQHDPPTDIIELFLTFAGPDILQIQDQNGMLPLHHACIHTTNESVIEALVEGYPDSLLAQDSKGFTPLHYSVTNLATSSRIVEKLCAYGAVTALDRDGMSPLHYVTIVKSYFQPSIISVLVLTNPQGLACPDREGRIPARYLARSCHELEICQILEHAIAIDPSLCKDDMALILLKGLVDCVKKVGKSINIQKLLDIILQNNPEQSHAFSLILKTLPSWLLIQRVERPEKPKNALLRVISKGMCFLKKSKKKDLDKSEKTIASG